MSAPVLATDVTPPPAVPSVMIWRLSVEQFHKMVRTGILTDDDPVELLEGWLVPKMPKNPPHRIATRSTRVALERVIPAGWFVDSQEPVTTEDSEPEPDAMVVRGDTRDYSDRHPGPEDVALVAEVADTTLEHDRTLKKRLFARALVPVYWIVNLPEARVEVYSDPTGPADEPDYRLRRDYGPNEEVPVVIEATEVGRVPVRELLP